MKEFIKGLFGKGGNETPMVLGAPERIDFEYVERAAQILKTQPNNPNLMKQAFNELVRLRDEQARKPGYGRSDLELMRFVRTAAVTEYLDQHPGRDRKDLAIDLYFLERHWGELAHTFDLWNEEVDGARLAQLKKEAGPDWAESSGS